MSREGSINVCRKLVGIHEEKLKGLKRKKELIEKSIASIEQDLRCEKRRLMELVSEGGK